MRANAAVIVQVGRHDGVSDAGIVIALAAAMQESSLRNVNYGDRDSLGLFQQRPSAGWGTPDAGLDPTYAARAFYGGPTNPNPGAPAACSTFPAGSRMSADAGRAGRADLGIPGRLRQMGDVARAPGSPSSAERAPMSQAGPPVLTVFCRLPAGRLL